MSGFGAVVPKSYRLKQARKLLDDRLRLKAIGITAPPTGEVPELTDQECALLALEYESYSYDALRKAFPLKIVGRTDGQRAKKKT